MLKHYFKTAWRSIGKRRGVAAINIIGLSIGMTAAILILVWVQNELNFDNFHHDAANIYRLTENVNKNQWIADGTPFPLADAAKTNIPEIEKIARIHTGNLPVFYNNGTPVYEEKCAYVDQNWFAIFNYDFLKGDANSFGSNLYSIILTVSGAKKYFGNREPIGSMLKVDSANFQVTGVVADPPTNSSFQYNAFIPLNILMLDKDRRENDMQWGNNNYLTFIKLRNGAHIAAVNRRLTNLFPDNADGSMQITSIGLRDIHFESDLRSNIANGNQSTVSVFTALAILLLLVACINYVNLSTANASKRAKEVSVRKMIGGQRLHLFFQFLSESLLISLIALICTLILVQFCIPIFDSVTGKSFDLSVFSLNIWKVIVPTLGVTFLLNSVYPALLLSSFKPINVFRGITVLKMKDASFRKSLVVFQFSISAILIAAGIIIFEQMQFIQHSNPGYNRSQVLTFYFPGSYFPGSESQEKKTALMQALKTDLLSIGGIEHVTMANQSIINIGSISSGSADWDGRDTAYNPKIRQLAADADYRQTMQLQMAEGRWFQPERANDRNNVILNEAAIKDLKIPSPAVGKRFTFKGRKGEIIGVVKDFKYQSIHAKTGPLIAFNDPGWYRMIMVRISPHNISGSLQNIERAWRKFLPDSPFDYTFLDESFNQLYQDDQRTSTLIFAFALIAVLISSLGLFGLAAFTAEQKNKEIGIRKVLGASILSVTSLLSKDFLKLVCLAVLIGTPVSWLAMNKWIENFAYRIDISWWMFAAAGILTGLIALITVSLETMKAALANPVKSLRTE